jgi:hypothetical protein
MMMTTRQPVRLDVRRDEWNRRRHRRRVVGQRHRRKRGERSRLAVDQHVEISRGETRDGAALLVEHRHRELHDVDTAAKPRHVLLCRSHDRRSDEAEYDDSTHAHHLGTAHDVPPRTNTDSHE